MPADCEGGLGLFCMNSFYTCGHWMPYLGLWCDQCYRDEREIIFPVAEPEDEEGFPLVDEGDED